MDVRFLGVGGALKTRFLKSCVLINGEVLIDAGPEVATQLRRANVDLATLRAIFISHLHADHYFGLPLLLTEYLVDDRDSDLAIWGPVGLARHLEQLLELAWPEVDPAKILGQARARLELMRPATDIEASGLTVRPEVAEHGAVQAYGFHVRGSATPKLYVTCDSVLTDSVYRAIAAADVAIVDIATRGFRLPTHMAFEDLERLVEEVPDTHFLVYHRTYDEEPSLPRVQYPRDGQAFRLSGDAPPELI